MIGNAHDELTLMIGDIPVMWLKVRKECKVFRPDLLPFSLKGVIVDVDNNTDASVKYEMIFENMNKFVTYLSMRVLSLDRENAKKILNTLGLPQMQDPVSKAKVALTCRGTSLSDNYWVYTGGGVQWNTVNLRTNSLSNAVASVALHGSSLSISGEVQTPELTTHGAYAKAWKRLDGELWLFKCGHRGDVESKIEVCVSNILDMTNINHVKYIDAMSNGKYCCKCKCMTTDKISIVSGMDLSLYCQNNNIDLYTELKKLDAESMYRHWVIDYLISNSDRHLGNWGCFVDASTNKLIGMHLMYDHNNAFDEKVISNGGSASYQFASTLVGRNISYKEAANYAIKRCSIKFSERPKVKNFIKKSHYESFMSRAKELGLL